MINNIFSNNKQISMKVITNDIVSIKAGTSMTFMLDSYKACLNAKQLAFQAGAYRKPEIGRASCRERV